jgi:hypothetical protein
MRFGSTGRTSTPDLFFQVLQVLKEGWWCATFQATLGRQGNNVKHYSCVPPDVRDYVWRELDRTADRKKGKQKKRLLREEVAAEGNVIYDIDFEDEELQRVLHASREEE